MSRPGWVTWTGLAVVLAAAAVLSFSALRDLAVAVGIPSELAWLLPVAVDGGLAVSTRAWLSRRVNPDAERFARSMTYSLIGLTIAGNAGQLGMAAHGVIPPWWVAVLVGAIAPAIVASSVHLIVLLGRSTPEATLGMEAMTEPGDDLVTRARRIVTAGAQAGQRVGRGRLADAMGISQHDARQLLDQLSANGQEVAR